MSRSRIAALLLLMVSPSAAKAQRVAEIDDFLKPVISNIAADPNVEGWIWETNRNGGYLLKEVMDVTGDGIPETFIASTLVSDKLHHSWRVFSVAQDGRLQPYRGSVRFDTARPVTQNGQTSLDLFPLGDDARLRVSDEKPYSITHYWFSFPEIRETISYVSNEEAGKLQKLDKIPSIQAILLADYLMNPGAKWSDVAELSMDAGDRYYLKESKERAEKNTAFTPQVALSQLGLRAETAPIFPNPQKGCNSHTQRSRLPRAPAIGLRHRAFPIHALGDNRSGHRRCTWPALALCQKAQRALKSPIPPPPYRITPSPQPPSNRGKKRLRRYDQLSP